MFASKILILPPNVYIPPPFPVPLSEENTEPWCKPTRTRWTRSEKKIEFWYLNVPWVVRWGQAPDTLENCIKYLNIWQEASQPLAWPTLDISLFQTEPTTNTTTIPPSTSAQVFSLINISPISSRKISNINKKFSARSNLFSRLQRRGRRGTEILKSLVLTVCF